MFDLIIEISDNKKFVGIACTIDEFISLCEAELVLNRMPHCDFVDKSVYDQLRDVRIKV